MSYFEFEPEELEVVAPATAKDILAYKKKEDARREREAKRREKEEAESRDHDTAKEKRPPRRQGAPAPDPIRIRHLLPVFGGDSIRYLILRTRELLDRMEERK